MTINTIIPTTTPIINPILVFVCDPLFWLIWGFDVEDEDEGDVEVVIVVEEDAGVGKGVGAGVGGGALYIWKYVECEERIYEFLLVITKTNC